MPDDEKEAEPSRSPKKPKRKAQRKAQRKAFLLRLSPDLHDELRRWAASDLRSLNAQVEYLLRKAVDDRSGRSRRRDDD